MLASGLLALGLRCSSLLLVPWVDTATSGPFPASSSPNRSTETLAGPSHGRADSLPTAGS